NRPTPWGSRARQSSLWAGGFGPCLLSVDTRPVLVAGRRKCKAISEFVVAGLGAAIHHDDQTIGTRGACAGQGRACRRGIIDESRNLSVRAERADGERW